MLSPCGPLIQYTALYAPPRLVKAILLCARPVFTYSCALFFRSASPHLSSHGGHGLTASTPCPSLPFTHSNSPTVTGIPIDVNCARPDIVWLSSRESDVVERSYIPARELSETMRALLYNLDNTITLRAKSDQRAWNLSLEVQGVHGDVNVIVTEA
jgi:hypothetical protein